MVGGSAAVVARAEIEAKVASTISSGTVGTIVEGIGPSCGAGGASKGVVVADSSVGGSCSFGASPCAIIGLSSWFVVGTSSWPNTLGIASGELMASRARIEFESGRARAREEKSGVSASFLSSLSVRTCVFTATLCTALLPCEWLLLLRE